MLQHRYSFVIPAYNEANRLTATLDAITSLPVCHLRSCEIVIVDDGSTDGTAEIARAYFAAHCPISVQTFPHRGKGFAIRQGVRAAQGEIVVLCDADLRESMNEVMYLIEALATGVDLAIGSRWLNPVDVRRTQPMFRRVSSRCFNLVAGRMLALPFKDTQCGLKAMTREAADKVFPLLGLNGWGYDLELIHVALMQGFRVEEIDLHFVHDYSDSHFRPFNDGLAAFQDLLRIRWNDLRGGYGAHAVGDTFSRLIGKLAPNVLRTQGRYAEECRKRQIAERHLEVQTGMGSLATAQATAMSAVPSRDDVAA